jgi:hypothetical protein
MLGFIRCSSAFFGTGQVYVKILLDGNVGGGNIFDFLALAGVDTVSGPEDVSVYIAHY